MLLITYNFFCIASQCFLSLKKKICFFLTIRQWFLTCVRSNPVSSGVWRQEILNNKSKKKFIDHFIFATTKGQWMHVWNLCGSVPPTRLTHLCRPVRSTFAVQETAFLGIMGAPRVPPLNPSETIVFWEHYRLWGVKCWNGGQKLVAKTQRRAKMG